MALLERAVAGNDAVAMFNLGVCLHSGLGQLPKNEQRAFALFSQAADKKYPRACYNVGVCYFFGIGVNRNEGQAATAYLKGAQLGDSKSMYNLAVCYAHGIGIVEDEAEAVRWYREAAALNDARSQSNLGVWCVLCCLGGLCVGEGRGKKGAGARTN